MKEPASSVGPTGGPAAAETGHRKKNWAIEGLTEEISIFHIRCEERIPTLTVVDLPPQMLNHLPLVLKTLEKLKNETGAVV